MWRRLTAWLSHFGHVIRHLLVYSPCCETGDTTVDEALGIVLDRLGMFVEALRTAHGFLLVPRHAPFMEARTTLIPHRHQEVSRDKHLATLTPWTVRHVRLLAGWPPAPQI